MKKMKKFSLVLVAAVVVTMLGGCGTKFDASAYLKAILDNSYKNDSTELVNQKVGTAEEAAEVYEQGIQTEMKSLLAGVDLSEELQAEYKVLVQDMLKNVKYTVGEAQKQDDGSFIVTVKYQPMQVFGPTVDAFTEQSEVYMEEITEQLMNGGEEPSDDELNDKIYTMLKDCLGDAIANASFGEEKEMTVTVMQVNNVYQPSTEDLATLEQALFDSEAMQELQ